MTVIVGKVLDRLGHAVHSEPYATDPRDWSRPFGIRHVHSGEALRLRSTQAARIPVDIGHDPYRLVGEVRLLAETADGDVWMVAECDRELPATRAPRYLSADVRGPHSGDVELRSVAITESPAMIGMRPIRVLDLDLADLTDAQLLTMRAHDDAHAADLLTRARDQQHQQRYQRSAPIVVHRSATAATDWLRTSDDTPPASAGWVSPSGRPSGRLRYGQPGRILSVR